MCPNWQHSGCHCCRVRKMVRQRPGSCEWAWKLACVSVYHYECVLAHGRSQPMWRRAVWWAKQKAMSHTRGRRLWSSSSRGQSQSSGDWDRCTAGKWDNQGYEPQLEEPTVPWGTFGARPAAPPAEAPPSAPLDEAPPAEAPPSAPLAEAPLAEGVGGPPYACVLVTTVTAAGIETEALLPAID